MGKKTQVKVNEDGPFDRTYHWSGNREHLRFHRRICRFVAKGSSGRAALIEFEDGERIVTSIRTVRKS